MSIFEILAYVGVLGIIALVMLCLSPVFSFLLRILATMPRTISFGILFVFTFLEPYHVQAPATWLSIVKITLAIAFAVGVIWDLRESAKEFRNLKIKFPSLRKKLAT
jgi:hypothetical protein